MVSNGEQRTSTAQETPAGDDREQKPTQGEQETSNDERVKASLAAHPQATGCETTDALTSSRSAVNTWRKPLKTIGGQRNITSTTL